MRTYRFMFDDNFNGVANHSRGDLVNRKPLNSRLLPPPPAVQRLAGQKAAAAKMGKALIEKLKGMGIK